ncbi:MAG TPA: hypothetical protein VFI41_02435 [Gemmatimonadales bacterium]|jgi:hypothetical protein|nr:hypothetical protein [Gemmatimonadales bacterium]
MKFRHHALLFGIALVGLGGCGPGPFTLTNDTSQTISLDVGQELDLTLGTAGPGAYQTPTISSDAVTFLGDSLIGPNSPAGPRQLFRFQGASAGSAIIVLTHSGGQPTITDTVVVQ